MCFCVLLHGLFVCLFPQYMSLSDTAKHFGFLLAILKGINVFLHVMLILHAYTSFWTDFVFSCLIVKGCNSQVYFYSYTYSYTK